MSYATNEYTGNGVTTNFALGFPYISTDHVSVSVDGSTVAFTWLNSSTITISPAPAAASAIRLTRDSSRGTKLVDFTNGASLTEVDLDLAATQALYVAQEAFDASEAVENTQALQDMVDAATAAAATAASSAGDANTDANAAAASASAASGSAIAAAASAVAADASADAAALSETAAAGYATSALLKANNLSDLVSASTARANLGLGTAATTAASAYATSAQGTLADSALQKTVAGTVTVKHTFETAGGAGALGTYLMRELKNTGANTNGARWGEALHKSGLTDEWVFGTISDAGAWVDDFLTFKRTGSAVNSVILGATLVGKSGPGYTAGIDAAFGDVEIANLTLSTFLDVPTIAATTIGAITYSGTLENLGNLTGSPALNLGTAGSRIKSTLTGNCTPTYTNPTDPTTLRWYITQDGAGSHTLAFPTPIKWPTSYAAGDKIVSTAAGALDLFVADWDGTTWHATLIKGYA